MFDRRDALKFAAFSALAAKPLLAQGSAASSSLDPFGNMQWGRGIENQRRADLGDGRFLNPVFAGDHPDPSIIRVGDDYYCTFSSFDAYPGLAIWHSRDLVNWTIGAAALHRQIGSVWAPDLVFFNDRFYLYIPARTPVYKSIYVITADKIEGPWSDPVDLQLPLHIDPCHVVDEKGKRWLFLSGGDRVRLSANGLATNGDIEHVHDPWRYPEDWVVETFAPEGPKIMRRGEYYYMTTAVGGTAGPPTGHMVIMARAKNLEGPWENDPANPLIRTYSATEKWWSRGHATPFEGPGDQWWMIYHGYENGYWTLGRQALLEPVKWTDDGWLRPLGGDLSAPLTKPIDVPNSSHGQALSDDFQHDRFGPLWSFYDPATDEKSRISFDGDGMLVTGKGSSPTDCSPICQIAGDQSYRFECDIELEDHAEAGLLLYYNRRLYAGLGFGPNGLVMHRYGLQRPRGFIPGQRETGFNGQAVDRMALRIVNDRNIVTIYTRPLGTEKWRKFDVQMEVSGYHHNTAYDFLSLRPAMYVCGDGKARFRNFQYEALLTNHSSQPG